MFRIGQGYDVHKLTEGRELFLCGEKIPHKTGLDGHSDADVALHALCDALLGAAALGDIGKLFPDNDDKYLGISSVLLLKETAMRVRNAGYEPINVDVTIIAQKPKISPYIPKMRENIAAAMNIDVSAVSVKGTTTEHLGFEGREEGIAASAVCLIEKMRFKSVQIYKK